MSLVRMQFEAFVQMDHGADGDINIKLQIELLERLKHLQCSDSTKQKDTGSYLID